jgi:hypothetical protein
MGSQSLLEMHLQVEPHVSAAEAHYIGDVAVARLKDRFDDVGHVIFHIDTYDDQQYPLGARPVMPTRSEVVRHLDAALSRIVGENPDYELTLYYHPEHIDLEIKAAPAMEQLLRNSGLEPRQLERLLHEELDGLEWFRRLQLWLPAGA